MYNLITENLSSPINGQSDKKKNFNKSFSFIILNFQIKSLSKSEVVNPCNQTIKILDINFNEKGKHSKFLIIIDR